MKSFRQIITLGSIVVALAAQAATGTETNAPVYDVCVQDDMHKRFLEINTQTGEYKFTDHFYDNCNNIGTWTGTGVVKTAKSGLKVTVTDKRSDQTLKVVVTTVNKMINNVATYSTRSSAVLTDIYYVAPGVHYIYGLDGTIIDVYKTKGGTYRDRYKIGDTDTANNTCACQ